MEIETHEEGGRRDVPDDARAIDGARSLGRGVLFGTFVLGVPGSVLARARRRPSRARWSAITDRELETARPLATITHDRGELVALDDGELVVLSPDGRSLRAGDTMADLWRLARSSELRGAHADAHPLRPTFDASADAGVVRYVEVALSDEAKADALLPTLLWSHDASMAMREARDRFIAAGRADLARDAEKVGARTAERWKALENRAVAPEDADPVAAVLDMGLGSSTAGTFETWPADPFHLPPASAALLSASRALWHGVAPDVTAAIVARVAMLPAEDVHAAVCALTVRTGSERASAEAAARIAASPTVWVAALLRPTHPTRAIAALRGATDTTLVPVLDTLVLERTPTFQGSDDEVQLIETRLALAPYDEAFTTALRGRFLRALSGEDDALELGHALPLLERLAPATFGEITAKGMRRIAQDLYVGDDALLATLRRTRSGSALMLVAKTGAFDLATRFEAAKSARELGVKEAATLAADLEKRLDRAMRREGM